MRVAYVCASNLGPYHLARFRAAADEGLELTPVLLPSREHHRPWQAGWDDCRLKAINLADMRNGVAAAFAREMERLDPEAVFVTGYVEASFRHAARWAKSHGVPSILGSDSTREDRPRLWLRELFKRRLVSRLFDAAFVSGARAAAYARSLGIAESAIWRGVDVVDNDWFAQACLLRERTGEGSSAPRVSFLTVTRLSPEKNLERLLRAFARYREEGGEWTLVIAGTGPLESELKRRVPAAAAPHVKWLGWKQYEELPRSYAQAGCFVLPSLSEPWGLVVNEALAAGLPVLVSRACGCVPELCRRGINGYDFDPRDAEELARLMLRMSSEGADRKAMGDSSRRMAANFTPGTWARALRDCLETTRRRVGVRGVRK